MDLFTVSPTVLAPASPESRARKACNRCHSQKLRCVRKNGEPTCERCLRLRTSCRFDPRSSRSRTSARPSDRGVKSGLYESSSFVPVPNPDFSPGPANECSSEWIYRPEVDHPGTAEQQVTMMNPEPNYLIPVPEDVTDIHSFWPDPFYELGIGNLQDQFGLPDGMDRNQFRDKLLSPDICDDHLRLDDDVGPEPSPTSTIQHLADLNIALCDCAAELPSKSASAAPEAGISTYGHRLQKKKKLFAVDHLFHLTSKFIDVVQGVSREGCDVRITSLSRNAQLSNAETSLSPQIDEGIMLMIASCYCRLSEIYVSLFQMIKACLEHSLAPQTWKDWAIVLPRLQLGSHIKPPIQVDANTSISSATSSMYMMMITMLSSLLCERLGDIILLRENKGLSGIDAGNGQSQDQALGNGGSNSVSSSQHLFVAAVAEKTDCLRQVIDTVKHMHSSV